MNGLKRNATPHICDGAEHNEKEDLSLDRYLERLKKFSKILAAPVIDMSTFFCSPHHRSNRKAIRSELEGSPFCTTTSRLEDSAGISFVIYTAMFFLHFSLFSSFIFSLYYLSSYPSLKVFILFFIFYLFFILLFYFIEKSSSAIILFKLIYHY